MVAIVLAHFFGAGLLALHRVLPVERKDHFLAIMDLIVRLEDNIVV